MTRGQGLIVPWLAAAFSVAHAATAIRIEERVASFNLSSNFAPAQVGFEFRNRLPITVTHLGQFGLNPKAPGAAEVAIWEYKTRRLVVSRALQFGATNVLEDGAIYAPISPVSLPRGEYIIGAQCLAKEGQAYAAKVRIGPGIVWVNSCIGYSNAFALPSPVLTETVSFFGPNFKYTTVPPIALSEPATRAVYQQNKDHFARVPIVGAFSGTVDLIEARAVVMKGFDGLGTDWQPLAVDAAKGHFAGGLALGAGGWYRLEVRGWDGPRLVGADSVERVGVGEVFVTAGQSNSANSGLRLLTPSYDQVSAPVRVSIANSPWQLAKDPQPIANGGRGSIWPALGDLLVERLKVPIGFISVGHGGTSVNQWQPGGGLFGRLRDALTFLGPDGERAVLWHQGESDGLARTGSQDYAQGLRHIIAQSRIDAGWDVPWGVALASYLPENPPAAQTAVLAGQHLVVVGDPLVFFGPATDDLVGLQWRYDWVHFNAAGQRLHAQRWDLALASYLQPVPVTDWRVKMERREQQMVFSWQTTNGLRLQKSMNPVVPEWRDVLGTLNDHSFTDHVAQAEALYRLFLPILVPPSIVAHPQSQIVSPNSTVTLNVSAVGPDPISYQWYRSGQLITGATNQTLVLKRVQPGDAGDYQASIANGAGGVNSAIAKVTVASQPTIVQQPAPVVAAVAGTNVTLSVKAVGQAPLRFQWYNDASPIADATNAVLALTQVQPDDAGTYLVLVSNEFGEQLSDRATLIVLTPPHIQLPPQDKVAGVGDQVVLSVTAFGSNPLSYQWSKDGVQLRGATQPVLAFDGIQLADAGNYAVTVSNQAGSIVSAPAMLIVLGPP